MSNIHITIFFPQGVRNLTKPGLHGGVISSIVLPLNISHDVNGVTYTCQASNPALQRSVNDAVQLNVMCKYGYFITGGSSSSSSTQAVWRFVSSLLIQH